MDNITHQIYELYHEDFIEKIRDDRFYKYYYNLLETGMTYSGMEKMGIMLPEQKLR